MEEQEKQKHCQLKQDAYDDLHQLAEIKEGELYDAEDECDEVEMMLEKVMRYGTYADVSKAIRHFVDYMHAVHELDA